MNDRVSIYELNAPFWAEEVMEALQEEGFHPALDDSTGGVYHSDQGHYVTPIFLLSLPIIALVTICFRSSK
jgi:hypothetical protein